MQTSAIYFALPIETSVGTYNARYSLAGLCGLDFPTKQTAKTEPPKAAEQVPGRVQHWHAKTSRALKESLAGKVPKSLPPLDLSAGSAFQQQVWAALLEIRFGQVRSYGEIAEALGKPKATRAVGTACGSNPVPVFVPCHRVLAAGGGLGGFSGGLDWKRRLLQLEGIALRESA